MFYHGTPEIITELAEGVLDFCLTDNMLAAASYGENVHVYRLNRGANIATEQEVLDMFPEWNEYTFALLDRASVRAQLVAAGFDGAEFEDDFEGGRMTTTRVFSRTIISFVEVTQYDWSN
jgi:hypothetical protein